MSFAPFKALEDQAATRAHHIAFISGNEIWTYQRMLDESIRLARALVARGINLGDRIALHMANGPELAIAYYACFRIGAIAVPINNRFKATELGQLFRRLNPKLYIGDVDLYRFAAFAEDGIVPVEAQFVVGEDGARSGACSWQDLLDTPCDDVPLHEISDDSVAVLLTTSGTTGAPKFVAHTTATLSADAFAHHGMVFSDVVLNCMPMVHAGGLFTFLASIRRCIPMVILRKFDADHAIDAIEVYRCSWLMSTPVAFAAMIKSQRLKPRSTTSLRTCLSAGDVCPPEVQNEFPFLFGCALRSMWGMTEAIGALAYGRRPGPVMQIPVGSELRLVDNSGAPVAHGEVGELWVRGPYVSVGYWLSPGCIDQGADDGWLATGDMMRQTGPDELQFVTRKKDLIVRGGSNISPTEVELVLKAHPLVRDAAVFGLPDHTLGERVAALIELNNDAGTEALASISLFCATQLADYKIPETLKAIELIPRNALGKIERKMLPSLFK
jgi:acyl-CoA synthetase (AMP-forming)/AMP-acid ligase II